MGAKIGFGILPVSGGGFTEEEKKKVLADFSANGWCSKFIEVTGSDRPGDTQLDIFEVIQSVPQAQITKLNAEEHNNVTEEWNKGLLPMDHDDWENILEFDTFLPNTGLGDNFEYYDLAGTERMISSLDYGIKKIREQKAEYEADNGDGEMDEDLERIGAYLNIFLIAQQNDFIVTISA